MRWTFLLLPLFHFGRFHKTFTPNLQINYNSTNAVTVNSGNQGTGFTVDWAQLLLSKRGHSWGYCKGTIIIPVLAVGICGIAADGVDIANIICNLCASYSNVS